MSDLAATNCGGGCGTDSCSIIWIILILNCLCGGGNGFFGGNGCGESNSCVWIILLLLFCGGGNGIGCGNNNGCGNFGCGCGC